MFKLSTQSLLTGKNITILSHTMHHFSNIAIMEQDWYIWYMVSLCDPGLPWEINFNSHSHRVSVGIPMGKPVGIPIG